MTALLVLTALAAGVWAGFLLLAVLGYREQKRARTGRLARVIRQVKPEPPARGLIRRLSWEMGRNLGRRLPARWLNWLRRRLTTAGIWTPAELFLGQWLFLAVACSLLALALTKLADLPPWLTAVVVASASAAPLWQVAVREADRIRRLRKAFPFLLDFISMAMEAGLSLEAALARAAGKLRGPLGDELDRYVLNLGRGMTRREALTALAEGVGLPEVREFAHVLIQADRLGLPLADVLRAQARQHREDRRLQAEEAAQKIPIKLLFPLVLFILPAFFLLVLGPAVLWALQNLARL